MLVTVLGVGEVVVGVHDRFVSRCQRRVGVFVRMTFSDVEPYADGHKRPASQQARGKRLTQGHREHGAEEANRHRSEAGRRTAGARLAVRHAANPSPAPRYSRPASIHGLVSPSSNFARGVLMPNRIAEPKAAATPRLADHAMCPASVGLVAAVVCRRRVCQLAVGVQVRGMLALTLFLRVR